MDPTKERTLRSVIDFVLTQFRELESKISWNVPTIHRNGKYVVGICAYKRHLTFSPWSPRVIEDFKVRLGNFVVWKNCFQIPVDREIDRQLVKDLVRQTSRAGLVSLEFFRSTLALRRAREARELPDGTGECLLSVSGDGDLGCRCIEAFLCPSFLSG